MKWLVCQIGAREHYALPRALSKQGALMGLITDFWVPPQSVFAQLPKSHRIRDRFHGELRDARVIAPNCSMISFELAAKLRRRRGWSQIIARNALFQKKAIAAFDQLDLQGPITLFSYSYAAIDLFHYARSRGWRTVLGQIDPGPEEERIVAREHQRYAHLASSWQAAPPSYWSSWRQEAALADLIVVNSDWSRQCLLYEGIPTDKIQIIPLVYDGGSVFARGEQTRRDLRVGNETLKVLFLGQINLRKGVGRLLDAMRLLRQDNIELVLAGPTEIDPAAWKEMPNVRWVGNVPRSHVGEFYRSADFFILPTLSDGYALTQLEAIAHGLPVIASKHCGKAVIEGENGFILTDLEPETIAQQIRRASLESFARVEPHYGLDELGKRLLVV